MKRLEYGVEKRINISDSVEAFWMTDRVKVFALAEDSETPYVIVRQFDYNGDLEAEIWLEDVTAIALIKHIQKALDVLPSSK